MESQYEVEHNVRFSDGSPRRRGLDMSVFYNIMDQVAANHRDQEQRTQQNGQRHTSPAPIDIVRLFRLVQEQFNTLRAATAAETTDDTRHAAQAQTMGHSQFLDGLISALEADIRCPPSMLPGLTQAHVDALDRVPRKTLKPDDECSICKVPYLEDEYCLVVEVPCAGRHRFDLECVSPWLLSKGNCPICRQDMKPKKPEPVGEKDEEEDDDDQDMMYA
ncbi:hypothetical protein CDD82_730 [Ophiocordyceps australis]|uniref:RING-type domain-containing protein n=1 Tax=Ophiocordyceps australis TaxID=1399860 RepID=A0A2C5ZNP2_9HYPO|nr:hypothetical protein CDD82_730 [Ophiocordyceps australis]